MSLHEELQQVANTPQLERITHELKIYSGHLRRNLEVLANLEAKQRKYSDLLKMNVKNIPSMYLFTKTDELVKAQTLDEIIKLTLKL